MNPFKALGEAIKKVRVMRYAMAVVGLASVVAIAKRFGLGTDVLIVGGAAVLLLMVGVVVLEKSFKLPEGVFAGPAKFLIWAAVIIIVVIGGLLVYRYFVKDPKQRIVKPQSTNDSTFRTPDPVVSGNGLLFVQQVASNYLSKSFYGDKSVISIDVDLQRFSQPLTFLLESDFYFKRPDKLRINTQLTIKVCGVPIGSGAYQIYSSNSTTFIYSLNHNEYIAIDDTTLDLFQRQPENDPIKQIAISICKPYVFLLASSEDVIYRRMLGISDSTAEMLDQKKVQRVHWQEDVRKANKWDGASKDDGTYSVQAELYANEKGEIIGSGANITQLIAFVLRNEKLLADLGEISKYVSGSIKAYASASFSPAREADAGAVADAYFRFTPEQDARHVGKFKTPFLPAQTVTSLVLPCLKL